MPLFILLIKVLVPDSAKNTVPLSMARGIREQLCGSGILGADKMGHCKSEVHLIETNCKRQCFQHHDFNTLRLHGPTFGSNHRGHSPWHKGVNVEEVGRGGGTSIKWVIFAYTMFVPS